MMIPMRMLRRAAFLFAALLLLLPVCACAQGPAQDAQNVLADLTAGDYDAVAARFDDAMRAALSAQALESAWQSVCAQLGGVTAVLDVQENEAARTAAITMMHEHGAALLTVVYDEAGRIAGMAITPSAAAAQPLARELPEGVVRQEVCLFAGSDRELKGELLLPANAGEDTPCVVFAHGSGPSDMDETIGGCKPLRDLAYDLAALGVASLRHDKITYVYSHLPYETVDQEYLEPVREALRVLRAHTGAQRVYLAGHSEGGMLAPYLVSSCGFDGGISLAGTPLQLWEVSYAQNLAMLDALPEAQRAQQTALVEAERMKAEGLTGMTEEEARSAVIFGMSGAYLRHMALMDQAEIAAESGKPFLFLWGDRDVQVNGAAFDAWRERLGEDDRYAYRVYPGLNHLFMPAQETDSIFNVQQAYARPAQMDAQVAADIAAWIAACRKTR